METFSWSSTSVICLWHLDLIKCFISASELTFEWYKNDRLVDDNSSGDWWAEGEFVVGGDQGQIFIMAAEHNHLGYYHCLAVNEFGTAKSEVIKASRYYCTVFLHESSSKEKLLTPKSNSKMNAVLQITER